MTNVSENCKIVYRVEGLCGETQSAGMSFC